MENKTHNFERLYNNVVEIYCSYLNNADKNSLRLCSMHLNNTIGIKYYASNLFIINALKINENNL